MTRNNDYHIKSVLRALDILEFLAHQGGTGRVTDIADEIGCSKNTAFRILQTLKERKFVRQSSDSSYELTFKMLNLGESIAHNLDLHDVARDHIKKLVQEYGETVSIGILDECEIVYLDRVLGTLPYHTSYSVGSRANAYSTALGKVLLAFSPEVHAEKVIDNGLEPVTDNTLTEPEALREDLEKIRSRGYAIDNQENILGIRCVAVPIFNRRGDVLAGMSVSGLAVRLTDEWIEQHVERLKSAAADISAELGYDISVTPS